MRIFLTGATGFIGGHMARRLAGEGHQLVCLVRPGRQARLAGLGAEVVIGDVADPEAVRAGLRGCEAVVHLAGAYAMWAADPDVFRRVNVEGTRTVMEAALAAGTPRAIYLSTVAVYGRPQAWPFREEDPPGPRPMSAYGRTKAAADQIAWDCARRGLALTAFYPGIVLGADDHKASGQYIQDLIRRRCPSTIYHHSLETYIYVGDVVDAVVCALARPQSVGQKYLLGGTALDGLTYARLISEVSGVRLPFFRFPDWMVTCAAYLLTWRANLFTHRPPPWGLAIDAAHTLHTGFYFDGSKAERDLGVRYTPVRQALVEAIESYRGE
jgi:dihydroflavonol-4-reductase